MLILYRYHLHLSTCKADQSMKKILPPYMNINPRTALSNLRQSSGVKDFASIQARYKESSQALVQALNRDPHHKELRLFSTWEITRYLIPIGQPHFLRVLKSTPSLPQGRTRIEGGSKWFSLEDVLCLRKHFAQEGARKNEYLPYRPKERPAKVITLANTTRQSGKTTTAAHLAMSAAQDGYEVLIIDTDPHGHITSLFGKQPLNKWETIFPLIAKNYAGRLVEENQARLSRGESPQALNDMLDKARQFKAEDLISRTYWPNIDILSSSSHLHSLEFQVSKWSADTRTWKSWNTLKSIIQSQELSKRYDLIIIDTPPSLGYLTINGINSADIILVPFSADIQHIESTCHFFEMIHNIFQDIEEQEIATARALGQETVTFHWDAVHSILTQYHTTQQSEAATLLQEVLGSMLLPIRQDYTEIIDNNSFGKQSVYEADYRDYNRETYVQSRIPFDETYALLKKILVASWYRDSQEME